MRKRDWLKATEFYFHGALATSIDMPDGALHQYRLDLAGGVIDDCCEDLNISANNRVSAEDIVNHFYENNDRINLELQTIEDAK